MKVYVVNEQDEVIALKERSELLPTEMHRCSALWITNSKGEILLGKRAPKKQFSPGLWAAPVAGTVEEGETYEGNIVKEAQEELGIDIGQPVWAKKTLSGDRHRHFTQWFTLRLDADVKDLKVDVRDHTEVRWFPKEELVRDVQENPGAYIKQMRWALENL